MKMTNKTALAIVGIILIICLFVAISWGITIGIIKLITMCFGLQFNLKIATGIWLVLALIGGIFKGRVHYDSKG